MTRKFSLAHLTALTYTPAELTHLAAETGFDFVSLRPIGLGTLNEPEYPLATDKRMLRETKQALTDTGLEILDIEMVCIKDGFDPKSVESTFEVSAEMGARHVLTTITTEDLNFAIETFAEVCDLAKPYGLTIDLEFITWYNVSTLKEAIHVVKKASRENGGILVDTLHFDRSRTNLEELDNIPQEWFHYAHLCDAPKEIPTTKEGLIHTAREERLYVGEGDIDITSIVKKLPKIPYSLEIPNDKRVLELGYEEHVRRSLHEAKIYLDNHLDC